MKFFFRIVFITLATFITSSSFAQLHPILDEFTITEGDNRVYISCIVSAGKTCKGINVLRSEDSLNFSSIARIDGTCGSVSSSVRYNFVDENPIKNKRSFYILQLGVAEKTNVLSIYITDTKQEKFIINPNPASGRVQILFENKHKTTTHFYLLNYEGKKILSATTIDNVLELDIPYLQSGIYPFVIYNEWDNHKSFGKLVIQN